MKTAGLIGGTGPESTIEYYRVIISSYRERTRDGSYPSILINSVNGKPLIDCVSANRLEDLTRLLLAEIQELARAVADFAALTANTPHVVFDPLQRESSLRTEERIESVILGGTELPLILRESDAALVPFLDTRIHVERIVDAILDGRGVQ